MRLAFKTQGGDGADLVMIHGFGSDRLSWLGNAPALMASHRVHALDLPGHGESSMDVGDTSIAALADAISGTLAAEGISRAHLMAHSLGGAIAMLMALKEPERVASLMLIAPLGLGTGVDHAFLTRFPELTEPDDAMMLMRRLVARPQLISKMMVARLLQQLDRDGARVALRRIASTIMAEEAACARVAAEIAARDIPRFVMWGSADVINPLKPEALASFSGQQLIIPDAGHLPHVEAARQANDAFLAFLSNPGGA